MGSVSCLNSDVRFMISISPLSRSMLEVCVHVLRFFINNRRDNHLYPDLSSLHNRYTCILLLWIHCTIVPMKKKKNPYFINQFKITGVSTLLDCPSHAYLFCFAAVAGSYPYVKRKIFSAYWMCVHIWSKGTVTLVIYQNFKCTCP